MKVAIITDTNSGISEAQACEKGIHLLPMPVIIDGRTYLEGIDIRTEELYEAMERDCDISTSQPSPEMVTQLWDSLLEQDYDGIVHIPMTSGLSGSCQTAKMLAQDYDGRVAVADNHRISVTQMESAFEAKRMADGGYTVAQIQKHLEQHSHRASIYLTVDSLKYLQKGGRLSPSAAMLGTLLNIKPVLSIQEGLIDAFAKVRGMKKCVGKMMEALQHDITKRFADAAHGHLHIQTAGTLRRSEDIELWKESVRKAFSIDEVQYYPLPCSIATHVGPDSMGVAVSVSEY